MNNLEKAKKKYENDYKIRNKFHQPVEVFQHGSTKVVSGLIIFLYYFLYYVILLLLYGIKLNAAEGAKNILMPREAIFRKITTVAMAVKYRICFLYLFRY